MLKRAKEFGILILAFTMQAAVAGPLEDYKSGLESYDQKDYVGAMAAMKKAADAGMVEAQTFYGFLLHYAAEFDSALLYYNKAATQGNTEAQFSLGSMYMMGEGTQKNLEEAIKWIRRSAEQGHASATTSMAQLYLSGSIPNPQSKDALHWIKRAADLNFIPAIDGLALAYRNGDYGLPTDLAEATQLEEKARKLRGQTTKQDK